MRCPRRQVVKPTSASRRSVPSTRAESTDRDHPYVSAQPPRRWRQTSHDDSKVVVSGPTQTCWRSLTRSGVVVCRAVRGRTACGSGARRPRDRLRSGRSRRPSPSGDVRERSPCGRRRGRSARLRARARGRLRTDTRTSWRSAAPRPHSTGSRGGSRVVLRGEIGELREPLQEGELLGADRAVAVLGKDHLRESLVL